ncbi:sigma-54-dependent Fis family transcriptional regulator [Desulfitobacterium hafniense]|uniref:sigma-54-dependent Fis family transcriptional regulator n=1 Tax=Desulfitobacterium hafniense TaxID=49338 RepID=UPI0003808A20|nr:sigma-54-dependent Fis family transcriptional regulator [Desulfitobacterium hafniense]
MASVLLEIQETVKKYTEIMAKISRVDVEVVDTELFRVAGTGMFADHVNEDMSAEGYAYSHVIKEGRLQVIYSPGHELICNNCPKRDSCAEEIEIAMPIRASDQIIGVIGLVGSNAQQRNAILADEETYLGLIEQIANFIAAKAIEQIDRKEKESMLSTLAFAINNMEEGVLIVSRKHTITMANRAAKQQLMLNTLEGMRIMLSPTGDKLNGKTEYMLNVGAKTFRILGQINSLLKADDSYAELLSFTPTRDLNKKLYAMTAAVSEGIVVGNSQETIALRTQIGKIANSTSTVLITGESGTGKEVVATAIWRAGDRKEQQFVAVNCAAIPESLLEAELFGYVKGAFTGADPNGRVGKFELANQGIIFLDEIGDMPLYLQAKLLRVLQERKITRIGSNHLISIDVRVIAATNKDIRTMIANGKFREDLYYRLNVIPVKILPLRHRLEDIPVLANLFAQRYAVRLGKPEREISPAAMRALLEYPWYGNVRELENTVEYMVNMCNDQDVLGLETLPKDFLVNEHTVIIQADSSYEKEKKHGSEEKVIPLQEVEQREIAKALRLHGMNTQGKKEAAKSLGISLATLYRKLEQFSN